MLLPTHDNAPAHGADSHEHVAPIEDGLRRYSTHALGMCELLVHTVLGLMLLAFILLAFRDAGASMLQFARGSMESHNVIDSVDKLLFVLMLTEILHTVGISIRSHKLVIEPFLLVAIIASIRRMLVITLEGSTLTKVEDWSAKTDAIFRISLVELGLLGLLVLVLVCCILLLRRTKGSEDTAGE